MTKPRKTAEVLCTNCQTPFQKAVSEIKRSEKTTGRHFCTRSCTATYKNKNGMNGAKKGVQPAHLNPANRLDEFTPYRYTLRCINRRDKEIDIELQDLKNLWESQKGICPYTKLELILPTDANLNTLDVIYRASLDRIDSNLGYIKGNLEFVSTPINYMKNEMSKEKTLKFLNIIASVFTED